MRGKGKRQRKTYSNRQQQQQQDSTTTDDIKETSIASDSTKQSESGYTGYEEIILDNARFAEYYQNNGALNPDEWESFYSCLKSPLPSTFRISGTKDYAKVLRDHLKGKYFKDLSGIIIDDKIIRPPESLPWYPDELAWMIHAGRNELRKYPQYTTLHEFLVQESDLGNISRQEAVSMIPPLLLNIKSHHLVLDMCAAPGSKTCQILEMMHSVPSSSRLMDASTYFPTGCIIANDIDETRAQLLVHQLKRMHSPCLIVTNNDASVYPSMHSSLDQEMVLFDRILCDVPCSGDGTLRKNTLIWRNWGRGQGSGLHQLQVDILSRGCQLLKEDKESRLVYSTCSLNPIENEAVLFTVLQKYHGLIELVDIHQELPGLKRKPGLDKWKVQIADGVENFYSAFEEIPEHKRYKVKPSFFPPSPEIAAEYHIGRSIRIYPHLQNTGGFFIAVLRKKGSILRDEFPDPLLISTTTTKDRPGEKKTRKPLMKRNYSSSCDPFIFQNDASPSILSIHKAYQLKEGFPVDQFLIRMDGKQERNNLFMASKTVKDLLHSNDTSKLKILYSGIRAFTKCEGDVEVLEGLELIEPSTSPMTFYRIQYEALPFIADFLTQRVIHLSDSKDLLVLLEYEYPTIQLFSAEFQAVLTQLLAGPYVSHYYSDVMSIKVPIWKGKASLNLLVNKKEKKSIKERWQWLLIKQ